MVNSNYGWICPLCGIVHSPDILHCEDCLRTQRGEREMHATGNQQKSTVLGSDQPVGMDPQEWADLQKTHPSQSYAMSMRQYDEWTRYMQSQAINTSASLNAQQMHDYIVNDRLPGNVTITIDEPPTANAWDDPDHALDEEGAPPIDKFCTREAIAMREKIAEESIAESCLEIRKECESRLSANTRERFVRHEEELKKISEDAKKRNAHDFKDGHNPHIDPEAM